MDCADPHAAENTTNKQMEAISKSFRPNISLSFAQMMRKPRQGVSLLSIQLSETVVPVYVSKYAVIIQLLLLNPCKSSVMATSEVETIVASRPGKKTAKHSLTGRIYQTVFKPRGAREVIRHSRRTEWPTLQVV